MSHSNQTIPMPEVEAAPIECVFEDGEMMELNLSSVQYDREAGCWNAWLEGRDGFQAVPIKELVLDARIT